MTVMPQGASGSPARGGQGGSSSLYDVLELILDRGLVIDAFVRVSLVGIEILKIDVRVVVASVDTYLRFAEACNRLDLESGRKAPTQLPDMMDKMVEGGSRGKAKGALSGAMEAVTQSLSGGGDEDEDEGDEEEQEAPRRRKPVRRTARRERE
ncbi:gas vesicle structural protein GvpA [Streptomyces litmocidini]|uniref:Gas vesicle protein A n=1 Tax=Streptomyces litmocidini TaxID=67318 RepID=A0ABW7TYN7_9ACTN|nr:gas vesicle structural protein GvpA [Streptomyces sp. PanSC19]ROQ36439.1 gas vesicle protein GvpA/GvpJ/GvpM family [Streptomyces sp. PanSC19]